MDHSNSQKTQKQIVGSVGEDIASRFLKEKSFKIVTRNYRKKFGEIDIVAEKSGETHFVEVKTVSCESNRIAGNDNDNFRAEDNVHPWKLKRLSRAIQAYLSEKNISEESRWQFDVVTVLLDEKRKTARVRFIDDIVL